MQTSSIYIYSALSFSVSYFQILSSHPHETFKLATEGPHPTSWTIGAGGNVLLSKAANA